MYSLLRTIHMYTGLLNLSIVLVFGVAGLLATFESAPDRRKRPDFTVEYREYTVPAGLDDKAVVAGVYEFLKLPLTAPVPAFSIKRDANNDLAFDLYNANGMRH